MLKLENNRIWKKNISNGSVSHEVSRLERTNCRLRRQIAKYYVADCHITCR